VRPNLHTVYFDGECGMCHGWVRFLLSRDPEGTRFRFAPTGSDAHNEVRKFAPPNTIVIGLPDGRLLTRSSAILKALELSGGPFSTIARLASLIPTPIRDFGYRIVARIRRYISPRPKTSCPIVPPHLRERFLS
jgi:predicted DCC family thiol-disulfide oxidoreductase YuxK